MKADTDLREAHRRFPIVPLTEKWAKACGHIDLFESDDPEYAFARLADAARGASGPYNCGVWVPPKRGFEVDSEQLRDMKIQAGDYNTWSFDRHVNRVQVTRYVDGFAWGTEPGSLPPALSARTDFRRYFMDRRALVSRAIGRHRVEAEVRLSQTKTHFAANYGSGMPHMDDTSAGTPCVRFLEFYHGPGTFLVPDEDWTLIENPRKDMLPPKREWRWKDANRDVVTTLLQVPETSVVAVNSMAFKQPVLHSVPCSPLIEGREVPRDRVLGVFSVPL